MRFRRSTTSPEDAVIASAATFAKMSGGVSNVRAAQLLQTQSEFCPNRATSGRKRPNRVSGAPVLYGALEGAKGIVSEVGLAGRRHCRFRLSSDAASRFDGTPRSRSKRREAVNQRLRKRSNELH